MAITRRSFLGLLLAAASVVGSSQDTSNSSALSPASAMNATAISNWTEARVNSSIPVLARLNASLFNSSANASSAPLSSPAYTAAIADFVRSILDQLNTLGLSSANSTNDTSAQFQDRLTTDLLIQLLGGDGAAANSGAVNRSHFSAPLNATINATALAIAAALSNSTNATGGSLRDSSDDITIESLKLSDRNNSAGAAQQMSSRSSRSDSSSSQQTDDPISLERVETDSSQTRVISHALAEAVEAALAAEAEAARGSAAQFHASSEPPAEVATATATSVSAAASEPATVGSTSTAVWIPVAAAIGAVVVLVGAAVFGFQNRRRQRGSNALSPGSLRLAQLTPPRELA